MSGYRDTEWESGGQVLGAAEDAEIQRRLFEEEEARRRQVELSRQKRPEISLQPTWEASLTKLDLEALPWPGQHRPGSAGRGAATGRL